MRLHLRGRLCPRLLRGLAIGLILALRLGHLDDRLGRLLGLGLHRLLRALAIRLVRALGLGHHRDRLGRLLDLGLHLRGRLDPRLRRALVLGLVLALGRGHLDPGLGLLDLALHLRGRLDTGLLRALAVRLGPVRLGPVRLGPVRLGPVRLELALALDLGNALALIPASGLGHGIGIAAGGIRGGHLALHGALLTMALVLGHLHCAAGAWPRVGKGGGGSGAPKSDARRGATQRPTPSDQ